MKLLVKKFGMEKVNKKKISSERHSPLPKVLPCQTVENIRHYGLWKQNRNWLGGICHEFQTVGI